MVENSKLYNQLCGAVWCVLLDTCPVQEETANSCQGWILIDPCGRKSSWNLLCGKSYQYVILINESDFLLDCFLGPDSI